MNKGIWIIAHGSKNNKWVANIDTVIAQIATDYPLITSFLEEVEGRTIEDGIKKLEKLNLSEVLVIPLFVSSGSNHIYEIKEILSKYKEQFDFIFSSCLDDHQYVVDHIIGLAKKLSINPKKELLFLVCHGSDKAKGQEQWEAMLNSIVDQLRVVTEYKDIKYATFLPSTIKQELGRINKGTTALAIPLFLSKGYYTNTKIPAELNGYQVKYSNKAYIEGNWLSNWIESQINEYDNKNKRHKKRN